MRLGRAKKKGKKSAIFAEKKGDLAGLPATSKRKTPLDKEELGTQDAFGRRGRNHPAGSWNGQKKILAREPEKKKTKGAPTTRKEYRS